MEKQHPFSRDVQCIADSFVIENGMPQLPKHQLKFWGNYLKTIPFENHKIVIAELVAMAVKFQELGGESTAKAIAQLFVLAGVVLGASAIILKQMQDGLIDVDGKKAVIQSGKLIAYDVNKVEYPNLQEVSTVQAFDRIEKQARFNLEQIEKILNQTREQSKYFFKLTMISAAVGFVIILIGILLIFLKVIQIGVVSSISGIIPEALALIFFKKDKELRKIIKYNNEKLHELQRIQILLDYALTEKDEKTRRELKKEIIKQAINSAVKQGDLKNKQ